MRRACRRTRTTTPTRCGSINSPTDSHILGFVNPGVKTDGSAADRRPAARRTPRTSSSCSSRSRPRPSRTARARSSSRARSTCLAVGSPSQRAGARRLSRSARSSPSSASLSFAARRPSQQQTAGLRVAAELLALRDRDPCPDASGSSTTSITDSFSTRSNGVPSISCAQQRRRSEPRLGGASQQVEVDPHRSPLLGREHLREAVLLTLLHPHHARPPARHVVRVLEQLPDPLGGGGE